MKNYMGTAILLGLLAVSAACSVVLSWQYKSNSGELRRLQSSVNQITVRRATVNQLAHEAVKYSERNPAIDPILQAAGAKPANAPAQPGTR